MCHSEDIQFLPFDHVVESWGMENDFFRYFVTDVTSARLTLNDCCAVISSAQLLMGASSIGNWTSMAMSGRGRSCTTMSIPVIRSKQV